MNLYAETVVALEISVSESVGWCRLKDIYDETIEGKSDDY